MKQVSIEKIISKKCKEVGILTPEELEELKDEIRAEQAGMGILDGVLFNPELYSREIERKSVAKRNT